MQNSVFLPFREAIHLAESQLVGGHTEHLVLCGLGVASLRSLSGAIRNRQLYIIRTYCTSATQLSILIRICISINLCIFIGISILIHFSIAIDLFIPLHLCISINRFIPICNPIVTHLSISFHFSIPIDLFIPICNPIASQVSIFIHFSILIHFSIAIHLFISLALLCTIKLCITIFVHVPTYFSIFVIIAIRVPPSIPTSISIVVCISWYARARHVARHAIPCYYVQCLLMGPVGWMRTTLVMGSWALNCRSALFSRSHCFKFDPLLFDIDCQSMDKIFFVAFKTQPLPFVAKQRQKRPFLAGFGGFRVESSM